MIAFASAFPENLTVDRTTLDGDPRRWVIRTDDGVSLFITDEQADRLAEKLRTREPKPQRKAA